MSDINEKETNSSLLFGTLRGYLRKDCFGRVFIDTCPTDEAHLLNTTLPEGKERPSCRYYLSDILRPIEPDGTEYEVHYDLRITACKEI